MPHGNAYNLILEISNEFKLFKLLKKLILVCAYKIKESDDYRNRDKPWK